MDNNVAEKIKKAESVRKEIIRLIDMIKDNNIGSLQELMENKDFQNNGLIGFSMNKDIRETISAYFGIVGEGSGKLTEEDAVFEGLDEPELPLKETAEPAAEIPAVEPEPEPVKADIPEVSTPVLDFDEAVKPQPAEKPVTRNDLQAMMERVNENSRSIDTALARYRKEIEERLENNEKEISEKINEMDEELTKCRKTADGVNSKLDKLADSMPKPDKRLDSFEETIREMQKELNRLKEKDMISYGNPNSGFSTPGQFSGQQAYNSQQAGFSSSGNAMAGSSPMPSSAGDSITSFGGGVSSAPGENKEKDNKKLMLYAGLLVGTIVLCVAVYFAASMLG